MPDRIAWLGYVLLIAVVAYVVTKKGEQWEFGRLGIPEPVFGADGRHPDGTFVDPANRTLVKSGWYQEVMWGLVLVVAGICLWALWQALRVRRSWREYREVLDELHANRGKS